METFLIAAWTTDVLAIATVASIHPAESARCSTNDDVNATAAYTHRNDRRVRNDPLPRHCEAPRMRRGVNVLWAYHGEIVISGVCVSIRVGRNAVALGYDPHLIGDGIVQTHTIRTVVQCTAWL
jgi:hypothetical protein